MPDIIWKNVPIISGISKTVSGTQNRERNVPNTAHTNVPNISLLLGTLFLLAFPVTHSRSGHEWATVQPRDPSAQRGTLRPGPSARVGHPIGVHRRRESTFRSGTYSGHHRDSAEQRTGLWSEVEHEQASDSFAIVSG